MKAFASAAMASCVAAKKKMFEAPITLESKAPAPLDNVVSNFLNLADAQDAENHQPSIVDTKDIDNYFNLQITTKLYIGSESSPHDLILDTGSMVSDKIQPNILIRCAVDLGTNQRLLGLWDSSQF